MSFLSWNVEGLENKLDRGTIHSKLSLYSYCQKFEFLFLTETWEKHEDNFEDYFENFQIFSSIRKARVINARGGILFGIRNDVKAKAKRLPSSSENILWVLITDCYDIDKFLICIVYFSPPNSSEYSNEKRC